MKTVNVAELKNKLSAYLTYAKAGEEVIIRERNLPVAKLIRFEAEEASDEDLMLAAAGILRLPTRKLDWDLLDSMELPEGSGMTLTEAVQQEREESR